MGSGWRWELRLPACPPTGAVLRDVVALAVDYGLSLRNTLGTITVIDDDGDHAFWPDQDQTITEIANGAYNTILWSGAVDGFLSCRSEAERAGARRGRAHGRGGVRRRQVWRSGGP